MFCKRCGKYNPDDKKVCSYCGGELGSARNYKTSYLESHSGYGESKTAIGVVFCLFLGLLGLIVGLLLYPSGTYERESFLSGWIKTLVVTIIVSVVIVVFTVGCAYFEVLKFM